MDSKRLLRKRLLSARAARPAEEVTAAGAALAAHAVGAWRTLPSLAAFASVGTEPPTRPALDALREHGVRVLLPVVDGTRLRWAPYDGWSRLVDGPFGLLQPAAGPLTGEPLDETPVVLVPALAVDSRGHRLGRGGGFYDRALAGVEPGRVVAVVFDDEVVDDVPVESHDRSVGAVLTPGGLRRMGAETQ
jgi:5-formyltetrahydrofolate cyclo-ligase